MKPGLIQPETGTQEVVWWDPSMLQLGEEQKQALWQDQVLKRTLKEDGGESLAAYREWKDQRERLLAAAAKPRCEVFLASQTAGAPPVTISIEFAAAAAPRTASGKRFGALVHAVLRDAPLDADSVTVRRFAELNARVLGAPPEEAEDAHAAVQAALRHPLLARARAAERLHREYPLSLRLDDSKWVEGAIDLAFVEGGKWVVVDFKTDADSSARREQYERQLQWYAYALATLTRMPASGVLLGV